MVVATTSRRPLVIALLTMVLAVVLLLLAGQFGPSGATAAASASAGGVGQLAQDPVTPSAPAGPALDPAPTEGDRSVAQNKIIIGVVAAVLLGTVIMGNRIRSARRKKIGAQTS